MKVMAIDYGDARTGVAVSDETRFLCGEAFTIAEWNEAALARKIADAARERNVGELVLGLPRNMDGSEGPRAEKCRAFAETLREQTGLPVTLWDERRTTIEAHGILRANGKKEKKHKATVDAVAASLMLEGYLSSVE